MDFVIVFFNEKMSFKNYLEQKFHTGNVFYQLPIPGVTAARIAAKSNLKYTNQDPFYKGDGFCDFLLADFSNNGICFKRTEFAPGDGVGESALLFKSLRPLRREAKQKMANTYSHAPENCMVYASTVQPLMFFKGFVLRELRLRGYFYTASHGGWFVPFRLFVFSPRKDARRKDAMRKDEKTPGENTK